MKKKILLIIALIVLLVPAFIFLVPVKDGRTIYKNIKYKQLLAGAVQPDNYDKMKISYVRIVDRKTGTSKFNTPDGNSVDDGSILSDMEGNDVSEKDDYVRTFDSITYKIEVGVALNLDNPDVDETTNLTGGVVKVKATLPDMGTDNPFMYWEPQTWMKNYSFSDEKRVITADYIFPEGETIVGGNQQLTFTIKTTGYVGELTQEQMPTFELWMEGNEPDNESSLANSKTVIDPNLLKVSGTPKYDIKVEKERINISGLKDGIRGRYVNFGVNLYLAGTNMDTGIKGIAYPTNRDLAKAKIQLTLKYADINNPNEFITLDENSTNGILNGAELVAYNKDASSFENQNSWPNPTSNYTGGCGMVTSTNGVAYYLSCGYKPDSFDSGDVEGEMVSNIISIKNTNISNIEYKNDSFATSKIMADAIEIFIPYIEDDKYLYQLEVNIVDYELDDTSQMSQDADKTNNSKTITYEDALKGNLKATMLSDDLYTFNGDIQYIVSGRSQEVNTWIKADDGPYLGGEERLITFDADKFELEPYNNGKYYRFEEEDSEKLAPETSINNAEFKFGVYKLNPNIGLTTNELINSTTIGDFDWYDSYENARSQGKITAIYWNNPDYQGYKKYDHIYFKLRETGNEDNIGKVGIARYKVYIYEDVERNIIHGINDSTSENSYNQTTYSSYNNYISGAPIEYGESFFIVDAYIETLSNIEPVSPVTMNYKSVYNVLDEYLYISNNKNTKRKYYNVTNNHNRTLYIKMEQNSPYISYVENSCNYEPYQVTINGNKSTLIFKFEEYDLSTDLPKVMCKYYINPLTPNNTKLLLEGVGLSFDDIRFTTTGRHGTYINISNLSGSSTAKLPSANYVDKNSNFDVTGNINNISDEALNNVKTIELLPKDGDDRNSVVHGEYLLKVTELAEGMTLYYSTGDIDEIGIETDGLGYKHIQNVDLPNDDRWIQVNVGGFIPPEATAIATLTDTIPTQTSKGFTYQVIPSNNQKGDVYYFGQYASSDNLVENIFSTYKSVTVVDRRISGTVFEDLNRNDLLNDTDAKLNNYTVQLLNETGTLLDETTTDSNGHYEFSLPDKGTYYIGVATNIPDGYEIIPKGTTSNSSRFDSTLRSDLIDQTGVAHNAIENVENINLGIRKKEATLVVKYLDKNDGHALVDQTEETVYYTDPYETHGLTTIPENYSFLENSGDPVADVVNKDYIEVIYYYDFTPATVTAKHYIDGTSNKIHEDVIQNKKFTQLYSTEQLDTTNLNYEYVRTDGDSTSGTVAKTNIVVNYYYRLKTGTVTTHHYLYDNGETTTSIVPDVVKTWNYTQTYTTSESSEVPQNYEFYKKSDNYTAVMGSPSVDVYYYYRVKDSNLNTSITKTGTEEITDKNADVSYEITYYASVGEYIGSGTITIVDNLPYKIDVDASNLDGGVYDDEAQTITWTDEWENINSYYEAASSSQRTITKNITLKYVGIVGRDRVMTNSTIGTITLSNNSREVQAQTSTTISIKGKIKVIYIDSGTEEEIFDAVEEEDLVGEQFISVAKEKDGYKLISSPDSETFEFEEEDQLVTYEYEHIKFEIKGKVLGVGGKIRGDEDVYWGDDSTAGNIIVEADDGYIIEAILVNGERLEIEPGQVTLVLENFKEVLENKNIEVIFAKKPQENPNTKAFIGLIILISWLILFTNAILLKKSQELE